MKIVSDTNSVRGCYIQLKDLEYLGNLKNNSKLLELYESFKGQGIMDKEFVRIDDIKLVMLINNDDTIINYFDYRNIPSILVGADILNKISLMSDRGKEVVLNAIRDLRDIMDLKRRKVDNFIPPFPTNNYVIEGKDAIFSTTVHDDLYILRSKDGSDISKTDYKDMLAHGIVCMYDSYYPLYHPDELDYRLENYKNSLLVRIYPTVKKSKMERIKAKIKKHKSALSKNDI